MFVCGEGERERVGGVLVVGRTGEGVRMNGKLLLLLDILGDEGCLNVSCYCLALVNVEPTPPTTAATPPSAVLPARECQHNTLPTHTYLFAQAAPEVVPVLL